MRLLWFSSLALNQVTEVMREERDCSRPSGVSNYSEALLRETGCEVFVVWRISGVARKARACQTWLRDVVSEVQQWVSAEVL